MNIWKWIGEENNARAFGVLAIGLPAAFAALTFVYNSFSPEKEKKILIEGADFWTQVDVNKGLNDGCENGTVHISAPYKEGNAEVTYRIELESSGKFQLFTEYATKDQRPLNIDINGKPEFTNSMKNVTNSFCYDETRWDNIGKIHLLKGENIIRFHTKKRFPHLKTIKLIRL